jgi:methyl-accepting chemotaxis protein
MRRGNEAITESALELDVCVGQIGRIVDFINGIADKSDLLALNAELEGVKAGEVGQGFSLVAAEMRRMAENVTRSTQEIGALIDRIRDATSGVVHATEAGMRTTEASVVQVDALSKSLAAIVDLAGHTDEAVRTISSATQQQTTGTDQLAGAMGEILSVTKETELATQAIIAANVELVRLAKDIASAVEVFRPA